MTAHAQPQFRIVPLSLAIAFVFLPTTTLYAANLADKFSDNKAEIDLSNESHYETLEWDTFNIESGQELTFIQKGSQSVVVNNINDASASRIYGTINANGHVYLVNTNGFVFNSNTNINTAGFLASTFSTTLNENDETLTISGDSAGSIDLQGFNAGESNQYVAFFSPSISMGKNGETSDINLGKGDAYLQTGNGFDTSAITINGLPGSFSIDTNSMSNTSESLSIIGSPDVNTTGESGRVIINQKDVDTILSSAVRLPEVINSDTLELYSANDIEVTEKYAFNQLNISDFKLSSKGSITISNTLSGQGLNLNLSADSKVLIDDSEIENEYGFLGGTPGINTLNINAPNFTLSKSIKAKSISIDGSISIFDPNARITLNASDSLSVKGGITFNKKTDLDIFSNSIVLNGIGEENGINPNDITIYSADLSLAGNYYFKDRLVTQNANSEPLDLYLKGNTGFFGNEIILNNMLLHDLSDLSGYALNFGSDASRFSSISLQGMDYSNSTLNTLSLFLSEEGTLQVGGRFSVKDFSINGVSGSDADKIVVESDWHIHNIEHLNLKNTAVESTTAGLFATGSSDANTDIVADLSNFDGYGLQLNDFTKINLYGTFLKSNSERLILNSQSINTYSTESLFSTTSGDLQIDGVINANQSDINIGTNSGSISLDGVNDASSLVVKNSAFSNNKTHYLDGEYDAEESIDMSNLEQVKNSSGLVLKSESIDLQGTNIFSDSSVEIASSSSQLNNIDAASILIKGDSWETGKTELYGNLTATGSGDLNFYLNEIILKDDISLTGNINLFDNKKLIENTTDFQFVNEDESLGYKVASLSGPEDITFQLSNEHIYLYDMGKEQALSSMTITGIDNEHSGDFSLLEKPVIAGALGLTVHGDWLWTNDEAISYTTANYNLDLSGVTLNANGKITLNTGAGDLSLGDIGTNGLTTDLTIEKANTLSIYGDLNLTKPENGYQFSNINAIRLYKDLTLGTESAPISVNFGDATIDGTYNLNIFSNNLILGEIGSNIALQNLSLWSAENLTVSENINVVGNVNINSSTFNLGADINTTGLDININSVVDINMDENASIGAVSGDIELISQTGNITLGKLTAGNSILVETKVGGIYNGIDDYISDDATSINIASSELTLLGKLGIGQSVASPIVIDYQGDTAINAESDGKIYIANLADAPTNSNSRIFDSSSSNNVAIIDAYNQLQLSSLNAYIEPTYQTTLGLIDHFSWQTVGEEKIKKIRRPSATPNLYYGREGWRLGHFDESY